MLNQPVVVITGASQGIGAAIAQHFAQRGCAVVLAARSEGKIEALATEIRSRGGLALAVRTDVTDPHQVETLVARTIAEYGRIDVLVNNAGRDIAGSVASLDPTALEAGIRLNTLAPVYGIRAVVPEMRKRGDGVIVNVSSLAARFPIPFLGAYSASKIALCYLSDAARMELAKDGIAVVTVLPGVTDTGFATHAKPAGTETSPLNYSTLPWRGIAPERVAEAVWRATRDRPREIAVGGPEKLLIPLLGPTSGLLQGLIAASLGRLHPTNRTASPQAKGSARHDRAGATALAGGIAAAMGIATLTLLVLRKKRR